MTPTIQPADHPTRSLPSRRPHHRSCNGKVARLPEATRHRINLMIDDGVRYRDTIKALGEPGTPELPYPISEMNLSNWLKRGFQKWQRLQEQLELDRKFPLVLPPEPPSVRDFLEFLKQQREAKRNQPSLFPP